MLLTTSTPHEQLIQLRAHMAYIEGLTAAAAPTFTIDANPDGPDESIQLVFIGQESLDRVKAVLLDGMRNTIARLAEAELEALPAPTA